MAALQKTSTSSFLPALSRLIKSHSSVIVGLSGGPDSVFLLHVLATLQDELAFKVVAAHLDHQWRTSSAQDTQFCIELCNQWNVPLVTKKASELPSTFVANGSQEQLGRNMRRYFLEQVRIEHNAHTIALAHHQDDQLETFFINLMRGTTISGMTGMKEEHGCYIRPLLTINKTDILTYLAEYNIPYCIDPTNESDTYLRNRIRSTLLPALNSCDNRARDNLTRAITNLRDTEQFLSTLTDQTLEEVTDTARILNLPAFFKLAPYLQYRVLARWLSLETQGTARSSEAFLQEIMRFLSSPRGGRHELGATISLKKQQGKAWIIHE